MEAFTKSCASNFYEAITRQNIEPYKTLAPTGSPTSSPTDMPTDPITLTNLALKGTTSQSSTFISSKYGNGDAWRAIEVNTNGDKRSQKTVTVTKHENKAWWKLNLIGVATIQKIIVWNRTEVQSGDLSNSMVAGRKLTPGILINQAVHKKLSLILMTLLEVMWR